jgi:hypothetical protein
MINVEKIHKIKYRMLLGVLIAILVIHPFFSDSHLSGIVLDIFISFLIVFVVFESRQRRHSLAIAVSLSLLALIANWSDEYLNILPLVITAQTFSILFIFYISYVIIMTIIEAKKVTVDIIFGAVCVYLLIGLMWTFLYSILELNHPGSFIINISPDKITASSSPEFIVSRLNYFSFVTLATIGYGDIIPVSHPAQMLSVFEAIIGQLYLTILIARFVGLYIMDNFKSDKISD